MGKEPRWIFFDIDGTLLYARGVGREAFRTAFKKAFDWEQGVEHVNFYGATDLDVFRSVCAERGQECTPHMEQLFFKELGLALDDRLKLNPPTVLPNVRELLSKLSERWKLGIVTGNIEITARLKLQHAGLLDCFDPRGFGCGCDYANRVEIARCALDRVGNPQWKVLIGDTPNDVHAAKANGMISIAVATGGFDFQGLEKTAADFVLKDLTDTALILSILDDV
jgi:phosphoglycolate phosphatase-like HAD superfamily hydrolase